MEKQQTFYGSGMKKQRKTLRAELIIRKQQDGSLGILV